jgi:nicotinamidase-related amidase
MTRAAPASRRLCRRTAVVVLDIQNDFCAPDGVAARYAESLEALESAVEKSTILLEEARKAGVPRIFVRSVMDNKYKLPKLLDRHRRLGFQEICREGKWGAEFYRVRPKEDECIVTKHTNDAFLYTFLEPLLRKHQTQTIVMCGVYTELCVEDTIRSALQRGFHVRLPEECTAGLSIECRATSLSNMRALQVEVASLRDLLSPAGDRSADAIEPRPDGSLSMTQRRFDLLVGN